MNLLLIWRKLRWTKTLEDRLSLALDRRVRLEYSNGGAQRIFASPMSDGSLKVVLDPMFEGIGGKDFQHLVSYLRLDDPSSKEAIVRFLSRQSEGRLPATPEGVLQKKLNDLLVAHFPDLPPLRVVMGRLGKRGEQKSIRLASYWPSKAEVRVHPYMLDEGVPEVYVTFLLYHELCHAQLILTGKATPGEHHGPDFYELENRCPEVELARVWERDHLGNFLKMKAEQN